MLMIAMLSVFLSVSHLHSFSLSTFRLYGTIMPILFHPAFIFDGSGVGSKWIRDVFAKVSTTFEKRVTGTSASPKLTALAHGT